MSGEIIYEMNETARAIDQAMGTVLAINFIILLFGVLLYVLSSAALYSLAKRRGIRHAWLSWIPIGNLWILGSLSDQYRYVAKGQNKKKRKILLTLGILLAIARVLLNVFSVASTFLMAADMAGSNEELTNSFFSVTVVMVLLALPALIVGLVQGVIRYMALYDVYMSTNPGNGVLFLVLSILFTVTEPFFLFCNRKSDLGMQRQIPRSQYYAPNGYQGYQPNPQGYPQPQALPPHEPQDSTQEGWNQQ